MVRLYLFAEGQTEQTFADTVLKSHLANYGVYMHRPVLIAHARKKGRLHKGGGRNFTVMQNEIIRLLKQETAKNVFFTTMIDLYALHANFPGTEESEKLRHNHYMRVEVLERSWFEETGDSRFIPFIQLHEFEAYLLSDVSQFAYFFDKTDSKISILKKIVDRVPSPELIDDGQHTAPSKRIIAVFPEYEDLKTVVGPQMAEKIGLANIRARCPHFEAWIQRLVKLGGVPTEKR